MVSVLRALSYQNAARNILSQPDFRRAVSDDERAVSVVLRDFHDDFRDVISDICRVRRKNAFLAARVCYAFRYHRRHFSYDAAADYRADA